MPLLQGGGTPLKLIEALAYGLPVIATPRAGAGLALHDGEDCLIAADAEQLRSGARGRPARRRAGARTRGAAGLVERDYSIEALSALLAP